MAVALTAGSPIVAADSAVHWAGGTAADNSPTANRLYGQQRAVEPAVGTAERSPRDTGVLRAAYTAGDVSMNNAVRPVAYTTGEKGRTLQWMAPGPMSQGTTSAGRQVQYSSRSSGTGTPAAPVRAAVGGDPFSDPFGDGGQLAQDRPPTPPPSLPDLDFGPGRDEPPPSIGAEPMPLDQFPELGAEPMPLDQIPELEAESAEESVPIGEAEEALAAAGPALGPGKCPTDDDVKTIRELRYIISPPKGKVPQECDLVGEEYVPRAWAPLTFTWKASGLCHKPVYFEDVHLERYGHSWGCIPQPLFSAAHFFLNVPVLPYAMGLCTPNECVYTLGYYRPGNCAPYLLDPLPLSVRAGLFQAGAWTGGVFAIP